MSVLLLGVTLGFDSFRACVGLAGVNRSGRRQTLLAVAFGTFDGLATWAGVALGGAVIRGSIVTIAGYAGPALLIAYGALLIAVTRDRTWDRRDVAPRWMIVGVPLALSLDNLVSGVALGLVQFPALTTAALVGTLSGVMAVAGLRLGAIAIRTFPLRADLIAGVMMVLTGVMLVAD